MLESPVAQHAEQREQALAGVGERVVDPGWYFEVIGAHHQSVVFQIAEGQGHAQMLQALRPDGSATFVGHERVSATLAGRSGTFVFPDAGTLDVDGTVDGTWLVVPGSATGDLIGLQGEGSLKAAVGEHASISLHYCFE